MAMTSSCSLLLLNGEPLDSVPMEMILWPVFHCGSHLSPYFQVILSGLQLFYEALTRSISWRPRRA